MNLTNDTTFNRKIAKQNFIIQTNALDIIVHN